MDNVECNVHVSLCNISYTTSGQLMGCNRRNIIYVIMDTYSYMSQREMVTTTLLSIDLKLRIAAILLCK